MTRRDFVGAALAAPFASSLLAAGGKPNPRILLCSGWQTENIGDIAHTPGMLRLLQTYLPDADVTFWPHYHHMAEHETAMLQHHFPNLHIVRGKLGEHGEPPADVAAAMDAADFFLHGSGPATVGWRQLTAFRRRTGKPFGVYGVTYGLYGKPERTLLGDASFLYFRDSVSLQAAKDDGIDAPVMEFGPDAVFALDVRDEVRADAYLKAASLEDGRFVVCLPKQRITPTWLHEHKRRPFDERAHARNEAMKEHDHVPLREAIVAITRETGMKILIGHEDETELPIGKDWLYDRLPEDVRAKVVWRDTPWTLEEAAAIYGRSAGMFSNEMHSPIMCIAQGIPAIVCRWAEQSSKGLMWRDIGLGDWLFDFDNEADVARMPGAALALARDPEAARVKAAKARQFVNDCFRRSMGVFAQVLQTTEARPSGKA